MTIGWRRTRTRTAFGITTGPRPLGPGQNPVAHAAPAVREGLSPASESKLAQTHGLRTQTQI
jgi:hypothetical protein